jgi:chromosome segregation ATPase
MADKKDVAHSIVEMGKMFEELESTEKNLHEIKIELGQAQQELKRIKAVRQEEQEKFDSEKTTREAILSDLKAEIDDLVTKKNEFHSWKNVEILKINDINNSLNDKLASIETKLEEAESKLNQANSAMSVVEDKKEVLKKIIELTDKL